MADRDFWKGVACGIIAAVLVIGSGYIGAKMGRSRMVPGDSILSDEAYMQKLAMIESMADNYYLNDIDREKMAEGLYTGLIYGLGDPYSCYYTAKEYAQEEEENKGTYVGIGILMFVNAEGLVEISEVFAGSAGEAAGLKAGDILMWIDDQEVSGMSTTEISDYVRSKDEVRLVVARPETGEQLEMTVTLSGVNVPTVTGELLDNGIGYIDITEFIAVTPQQFADVYSGLLSEGMTKLIVDLRGNPGGLLASVCDVLRQILPEGLIVYTQDKYGEREEEYCDGTSRITMPMAVLINGGSASAAEIFAGAVKDYELGPLIGTTTFGKGIVQSIYPLSDGSALRLTSAKYYTPKGNHIHDIGIEPDIEVFYEYTQDGDWPENDNQLQAAMEALEEETEEKAG